MKSNTKTVEQFEPEGPAIITELHVLGRPATDDDGKPIIGKQAWKLLTKVQNLYARGMLDGGKRDKHDRMAAANEYATLVDTWAPGGTDSTQKLNVSRSTGAGNARDAAIDAGNRIAAIKRYMAHNDSLILRMVFENGEWPAIAVKEVTGDYEDSRPARFRECLDNLIDALARVRKEFGQRKVAGGVF